MCKCDFDHRIAVEAISFSRDQRSVRKMMLSAAKDALFIKRKQQAFNKLKPRKTIECDSERLTISKLKAAATNKSSNDIHPTTLRPHKEGVLTSVQGNCEFLEEETPIPAVVPKHSDADYNVSSRRITGGKA